MPTARISDEAYGQSWSRIDIHLMERRGPKVHVCNLDKGSKSCLPKLAPQAGRWRRLMRNFHKCTIVSNRNPRTPDYIRSRAALTAEKSRHLRTSKWYIIHPLSIFCMYREMVACVVWYLSIWHDTHVVSFFYMEMELHKGYEWHMVFSVMLQFMLIINMGLNFIIGYDIKKTKEIVLKPRMIVFKYLSTSFLLDLLITIPPTMLMPEFTTNTLFWEGMNAFAFLRIVKIVSINKYLRQITWRCNVEDTTHYFITLIVSTIFLVHWLAGVVYYIPKLRYIMNGGHIKNTWLEMANLNPTDDTHVMKRYAESLLAAVSHFYGAGTGMYVTDDTVEFFLFSIIYIFGSIYCAYIIIMVFEIVSSCNASESKYEEIIHQLKEYMKMKNLPISLRKRLLLYYQNRFHQHFFKETAILLTLSEHLRQEVFLHTCKHLMEKVKVFEGLQKATIGNIVSFMKPEVFLPNDIIIRAGERSDAVYFIGHGTVAVYHVSGKEVMHYEDGDHFGDLTIILKKLGSLRKLTIIAADISEIFRLDKKDLLYLFGVYPTFAQTMVHHGLRKVELLRERGFDTDTTVKQHTNVLDELRRGRILDRIRRRPPAFVKKFEHYYMVDDV